MCIRDRINSELLLANSVSQHNIRNLLNQDRNVKNYFDKHKSLDKTQKHKLEDVNYFYRALYFLVLFSSMWKHLSKLVMCTNKI